MSPSVQLTNEEQVIVLQHLLGPRCQQFVDGLGAVKQVFSTPYEPPQEIEETQLSFGIGNNQLVHYRALTIDLTTKEASGRTLMGLVLLEMTSAIQKKHESKIHLNVDYLFNTKRSGPNYAADVAVI